MLLLNTMLIYTGKKTEESEYIYYYIFHMSTEYSVSIHPRSFLLDEIWNLDRGLCKLIAVPCRICAFTCTEYGYSICTMYKSIRR